MDLSIGLEDLFVPAQNWHELAPCVGGFKEDPVHEVHSASPATTRNTHFFPSGTLVSVAVLHDAYGQGRVRARETPPQSSEDWRKELASEWAHDMESRAMCVHYLT